MTLVLAYDVVCAAGRLTRLSDRKPLQSMQAILQAAPQLMQVAGDLLVKNLDWPGADELAERLKKTIPPELQDEEKQQIRRRFSKQCSRWNRLSNSVSR